MHRTLGLTITALALAGTASADWNTGPGGNSARDCLTSAVGPTSPEILWQGGLPAIVSQQAVIEGSVVVMPRITNFDIPTGTTIIAQDLNTGDTLWTTQLPFNAPDEWRSRVSAVRDGQVYATRAGNTNEAPLYSLDIADGSIIWESEDTINESTTEGLAFTTEGDLIVGNFNSVMRISRVDGMTMWQTSRSCPTSNGCLASVFGDRVYLYEASVDGPVVTVFNATTGVEMYSSPGIGGGFIQQLGLFIGSDGTIYAPRTQNNEVTDFIVAFEDTGLALVEKWSHPLGYCPFGTMGVGPDGSVYAYITSAAIAGNDTFRVVRLDPNDGALLDESPALPFDFPLGPRMAIDADGRIFLTNGGFSGGRLFSLNADLTVRWDVPLPGNNLGGPAIGDNGVLIVCGTGTDVRAYKTEPKSCLADVVGDDGEVDVADLLAMLGAWGGADPDFDIAPKGGDGSIDILDLLGLLAAWGPCP